jgi:hypothetical protein
VLIPGAQQCIAILSQVANDIADFVRRKADVYGDAWIVKPEFGFFVSTADVDMRRLIALVRVKERAIGPPAAFVPTITNSSSRTS